VAESPGMSPEAASSRDSPPSAFCSFLGGSSTIVMASTQNALGGPRSSSPRRLSGPSTTTTSPDRGRPRASGGDDQQHGAACPTTTTRPGGDPRPTHRPGRPTHPRRPVASPRAGRHPPGRRPSPAPGTVQLLELPSGDADAKTREVWVYRPRRPPTRPTSPVVYPPPRLPGHRPATWPTSTSTALLDQQFAGRRGPPFVVAVPQRPERHPPPTPSGPTSVDGEGAGRELHRLDRHPPRRRGGQTARDALPPAPWPASPWGGYGAANPGRAPPWTCSASFVSIAGYYPHRRPERAWGAGSPRLGKTPTAPTRNVTRPWPGPRTLLIVDSQESDPADQGRGAPRFRLPCSGARGPRNPCLRGRPPGTHSWQMVAGQGPDDRPPSLDGRLVAAGPPGRR